MGRNLVLFLLLVSASFTVTVLVMVAIHVTKPLVLSFSDKDSNFELRLLSAIKLCSHVESLDVSNHRPNTALIQVRLKDTVYLIDDDDVDVRFQKFKRILELIDRDKIKILKRHDASAIAVVVLACDRVTVRRCLDRLLLYRPSPKQFPVIVSQACSHHDTEMIIREYGDQVFYIRQRYEGVRVPSEEFALRGYFRIADHYKRTLNRTFVEFGFQYAIIVEDDLDIASDFFEYFTGTLPILRADPTLWCVSAWNDNGKIGLINDRAFGELHRTDFFPGLGWMLARTTWTELVAKWPASYWDDWMRMPEQRKGRSCIRPEIPRSRSFGKNGVSSSLFFDRYLKDIHLNEHFYSFTRHNLTYLLKNNYDTHFLTAVNDSPIVSWTDLKRNPNITSKSVRIIYDTQKTFEKITGQFRLLKDAKGGVPRTAYKGIVSFYYRNHRVYLTPGAKWTGYNVTWK